MTVSKAHCASPLRHPKAGLLQECGLFWPKPALWSWPPDVHLTVTLVSALPVWIALAILAGPHLRTPIGWLSWASLVLVQPLLEELVFRGLLQGQALRLIAANGAPRRLGPVSMANVLVTLGFVALHLRAQPLAWALAVAGPSLVLGHLRERTGSVWPPVFVHAFYNAGFGLTAWLVN